MSPQNPRCGMPCLKHPHGCDRLPGHTGVHRDVQQKGNHSCEWETPRSAKDVPVLLDALRSTREKVGQLREMYQDLRTRAREVERQRDHLNNRWRDEHALRKQAAAERDRLAEQVRALTNALMGAKPYCRAHPEPDQDCDGCRNVALVHAALNDMEAGK